MRVLFLSIIMVFLATALPSFAADSTKKVDAGTEKQLRDAIKNFAPNMQPDSISRSPIEGLYEVVFGPKLFYFSADGQFLVDGVVFDLKNNKDLTEPKISAARLSAIDRVGEDKMLVFGPKDAKYTITVFTDIDCPYCQKLHGQIDEYNKLGIKVRYMLYPRAPAGTPTYKKAVSVWCANDKTKTFTEAKAGKQVAEKTCDNPVQEHVQLGRLIGVTGTPSMVSADGTMIPGYVPPKELLKALEKPSSVSLR